MTLFKPTQYAFNFAYSSKDSLLFLRLFEDTFFLNCNSSNYSRIHFLSRIKVIDYDRHCLIQSNVIYGYIDYSTSFGLLDRDTCLSRHPQLTIIIAINSLPELIEVVNSTRRELYVLNVHVYGTECGQPAA